MMDEEKQELRVQLVDREARMSALEAEVARMEVEDTRNSAMTQLIEEVTRLKLNQELGTANWLQRFSGCSGRFESSKRRKKIIPPIVTRIPGRVLISVWKRVLGTVPLVATKP